MWFLALKFFMRETFSRYSLWIAQENTNKTSKKEVKDYFRCQMEQEIVCVWFSCLPCGILAFLTSHRPSTVIEAEALTQVHGQVCLPFLPFLLLF